MYRTSVKVMSGAVNYLKLGTSKPHSHSLLQMCRNLHMPGQKPALFVASNEDVDEVRLKQDRASHESDKLLQRHALARGYVSL